MRLELLWKCSLLVLDWGADITCKDLASKSNPGFLTRTCKDIAQLGERPQSEIGSMLSCCTSMPKCRVRGNQSVQGTWRLLTRHQSWRSSSRFPTRRKKSWRR